MPDAPIATGLPLSAPAVRGSGLRPAHWCIRHARILQCGVLLYAAINALSGLGSTAIKSFDEARYGVTACEMARSGNWLVTTYGGKLEFWNLKPPLGYWPMAAAFRAFGVTPWSLRISSAIAAIATVGLLMSWTARRLGRRASILAGVMAATAHGYLTDHGARAGDLDALVTLCAMGLLHLQPLRTWTTSRAAGVGLMLGLAFLIKSFALAPYAIAAGTWTLASGTWRSLRWRHLTLMLGAPVILAVAWMLARSWSDGSTAFVACMINEDLLGRVGSAVDDCSGPWYGYLLQILDCVAPWPEMALVACGWLLWRRSAEGAARWPRAIGLLLLWTIIPLALCSAMGTHHQWYIYPLLPPLLAGLAWCLLRAADRLGPSAVVIVVIAMLACQWRLIYTLDVRHRMRPAQRALLADAKLGPPGTSIFTPPLDNAERFILEGIHGYDIHVLPLHQRHQLHLDGSRGVLFRRREGMDGTTIHGVHGHRSCQSLVFDDPEAASPHCVPTAEP